MESVTIEDVLEFREHLKREICPIDIAKHLYNIDLNDLNNKHFAYHCSLDKVWINWLNANFYGFRGCHRIQNLNFIRTLKKSNIPYEERCNQFERGVIDIFVKGSDLERFVWDLDNERGEQFRNYLYARTNALILYAMYTNLETSPIRPPNLPCGHTLCKYCFPLIRHISKCCICQEELQNSDFEKLRLSIAEQNDFDE